MLATLFEFDDMPADFPAGLHLHRVHRPQGTLAALRDQLAQRGEQGLRQAGLIVHAGLLHATVTWPFISRGRSQSRSFPSSAFSFSRLITSFAMLSIIEEYF